MALIHDVKIDVNNSPVQDAGLVDFIRDKIVHEAWEWFWKHAGDVVIQKKILFFKVNITVAMLEPLFEVLFGSPTGSD